jgi:adenosylhomocysteine nucleosidase
VWQAFVRSWIQQQVRQTAAEAIRSAREAPGKTGSDPPTANQSQPQTPDERRADCDVGFVFALGIEAGGLEDLLQGVMTTRAADLTVREGLLHARRVALVTSGVGQLAAARGTQALIAGHRPSWVISAGFAGGLDPRLKKGDIVMADSLVSTDGRRLTIDLKISPEALATNKRLHVGACADSPVILPRPDDKRALGRRSGALSVDMESWAVGEVCRQAKTRFLSIRVISDAVDDELPPDVETLARQKTTASRLGAAAGAVFRRPSSVKDMLQLKEDALVLTDRLARFLSGIVEQLVPARPDGDP